MNTKYFDIDSTYRNRNMWPLASQFEIPVSTLGTRPACQAVDPVCNAAPITSWTSNAFNKIGDGSFVNVNVTPNACDPGPISTTNDNSRQSYDQ